MTYQVYLKPSARKEMEGLPDQVLRRVDRALLQLETEPRPRSAVKLAGVPLHRLRVGSYRVLYQIDDARQVVEIVGVRHRREAYRR